MATVLLDRAQRVKIVNESGIVGSYRDTVAAPRENSPGGIPPVKWRHQADR